MKFLVILLALLSFQIVNSQELPRYYGNDLLQGYQDHTLKNEELKAQLFLVLSGGHIKNENAPDTIVTNCDLVRTDAFLQNESETPEFVIPSVTCTEHRALGYDRARRKLFGQLHLKTIDNGNFSVKDVYCEKNFTDLDFGGTPTFGPDMVPSSGNLINTEHTWPQSRFTGRFNKELQKSDLHHLFPTDSEMNSRRGSLRFGNVTEDMEKLRCPQNRVGRQADVNGPIFEVPNQQKGNTARAIFYFATRYQMKLSPSEEKALRQWHVEDPADEEEFKRNNEIEKLQGNRNPFIDFSDLVDRIENFNSTVLN